MDGHTRPGNPCLPGSDGKFNGLRIIAYTAHALPEEKRSFAMAGFADPLIRQLDLEAVENPLAGNSGF